MKTINIVGCRFGRLVVTAESGRTKGKWGRIAWKCQCDCGNTAIITGKLLKNGESASCGCLRRETTKKRFTKHGSRNSPEYSIWSHIIQRCTNKNNKDFKYYGGRGITVCSRWQNSFAAFISDMGKRPHPSLTIERDNNKKGYSRSNCRWATRVDQSNNKRNNHLVFFDGKTQSVAKWSREMNIPYYTLLMRIRNGWNIKNAMLIPVHH